MIKKILFAVVVLVASTAFSQDDKKFEWSMEGQVVCTTNGVGMYTNFGGPGLRFNFKHFSVGYNMMPSLRFENNIPNTPLVTPILGTGPQLYFLKKKKLVLSFPAYYVTSDHKWTFTAGIGYVLTNKK